MRTSEVDPNASGEIQIAAVPRHDHALEKKVIVNKRMLLATRKLRARTIK